MKFGGIPLKTSRFSAHDSPLWLGLASVRHVWLKAAIRPFHLQKRASSFTLFTLNARPQSQSWRVDLRCSAMTTRTSTDQARRKPPPLQTGHLLSQQTTTQLGSPTQPETPKVDVHQETDEDVPEALPGQQRFVLTDSVAFRYLQEDPSTTVLARRHVLRGYECYVVEQWATSRSHPTFVVTTYTGDRSHSIVVGVLSVPTDESTWSPRLRVYFKALNQYHARRQETSLGILMVTNLSRFPSSLTVVPIPEGDILKHRHFFFVSENLKRLGCSGRVGLTLATPATATVAKFHQLYRTSDKNEALKSVVELVKLCQRALTLFGELEIDYADGLLCDVTERAINDWWVEMGSEQYNIEPHDGILGPTTVAGLLGLLMGARNRLHSENAPVSKDPFDMEAMKRGIGAYQKHQRLPRTRRLDRRTLNHLHKTTQRAANKERWAVPKAVKSTVAELSGKGGEMVMDAVGRRDRAGIAEIETVDIDRFVQLVYGERCKWLWLGRPLKKSKVSDGNERVPEEVQEAPLMNKGLVFRSDEHGGFTWTARKSTVEGMPNSKLDQQQSLDDFDDGNETDDGAMQAVFKRANTFRHDAKSGLGRVKGAVGLKGHHKAKPSTDESVPASPVDKDGKKRPLLRRAHTSPLGSPNSPLAQTKEGKDDVQAPAAAEQTERLGRILGRKRTITNESIPQVAGMASMDNLPPSAYTAAQEKQSSTEDSNQQPRQTSSEKDNQATSPSVEDLPSIAGSIYKGVDLNETLPSGPETESETTNLLRRTASNPEPLNILPHDSELGYPRHLSFSLASSSVLHWASLSDSDNEDPFAPPPTLNSELAAEKYTAAEAKQLRHLIALLHTHTAPYTAAQIERLNTEFLTRQDSDGEALNGMLESREEEFRELQAHSETMIRNETERFEEGAKEIETLAAKLDYEIQGLRSRIDDAANNVGDYEKGVRRVEERVLDLEREAARGGRCVMM